MTLAPLPNPAAKYLYWSCAVGVSIGSIIGYQMFLKNNNIKPVKETKEYKYSLYWQRLRLLLAGIQIIGHTTHFILRNTNAPTVSNIFLKNADNVYLKDNGKSWNGAVTKCNVAIPIFMSCSLFFVYNAINPETKLIKMGPNIKIEILSCCAWLYVLLYRLYYGRDTVYQSWGIVRHRIENNINATVDQTSLLDKMIIAVFFPK
eukprot:449942_1